jgi:SAM-dependent MidA family methyltransferase
MLCYLSTIDYGYDSSELYRNYQKQGTLVCYKNHGINDYPFHAIGDQDITAHVNFSALQRWGLKNGLLCSGYTNQAHFLLSLGFTGHLKKVLEQEPVNYINYKKEAFIKRTFLMDMGSRFKVLIQRKGVPGFELTGLKLADPASKKAARIAV